MANIAECGVAIAKSDINKLGGAIKQTKSKDGYQAVYAYEAKYEDGTVAHIVVSKIGIEDGKDSSWEHTYTVDGCTMPAEEYQKKYADRLFMDATTWRVIEEKEWSNGWEVNWKELGTSPYQSDTNVHEYDDHITIYFGGRWSFPETLENFLNGREVAWQGAEAEDGCSLFCDTIGSDDFGLRVVECGDEEDWHCVEDMTKGGK